MATYTFDKIKYDGNTYVVTDSGALQLTGGQVTGPVAFGDSVAIDEATIGDLVVSGNASFANNISANTINGVTVGSDPQFTDTNTEVSTLTLASGSTAGTSLTSGGKFTLTAGSKTVSFTMPTIPTVPSNIVNTITTTAGAHTAITSQKGDVSFNVPTTAAHVGAATSDHVHGNITNGGDITATAPTIASGDQIIINDHSASKITNGPTFDGSTTTKALTPKGTWETFATSNTNTTYTLSNALSSHKFTSTLTAGGSGSGTSTATMEFVAGTGITLTDDTTNKKITIALTSDIPTAPTITLNGSTTTTPSFYAPTSAGTNGYVLKSNGSGAPTWTSATLTDTKVTTAALTSGTTYYPILATGTGTATRQIDSTLGGLKYISTAGTTSAVGTAVLQLGNATASGTANNEKGVIRLYGTGATYYTDIVSGTPTANRTITLPNATGTVALTSDIPIIEPEGDTEIHLSFDYDGSNISTFIPIIDDDTGTISASILPASGVTAGTYDGGLSKNYGFYMPSFTVDTKGRITAASDSGGTLIPMINTSSESDCGNLLPSLGWASALRNHSYYISDYYLSPGDTSTTITIENDYYSAYSYKTNFKVIDVKAYDLTTYEPVIVDWSTSSSASFGSSITITVSIASAYTSTISLYPITTVALSK